MVIRKDRKKVTRIPSNISTKESIIAGTKPGERPSEPCPKCGWGLVQVIGEAGGSGGGTYFRIPSDDPPSYGGAPPRLVKCSRCGHEYETYVGLN